MNRLPMTVWLAGVLLASSVGASGQTAAALKGDVYPLTGRGRNGAPVPVWIELQWAGTQLLRGDVELVFGDSHDVRLIYRLDDIVVPNGTHRFFTLIPPPGNIQAYGMPSVSMRFLTDRRIFELGKRPLPATNTQPRRFVLGMCYGRTRMPDDIAAELIRHLRLERFSPDPQKVGPMTHAVRLDPIDLPSQPLAYCGFDVLVLHASGFGDLRGQQLDAISQWAFAGGSVLIFATGPIEPRQLEFLNGLTGVDETPFARGGQGELLSLTAAASAGLVQMRPGLGRAVIVTEPPNAGVSFDDAKWRSARAFLWKLRGAQVRSVQATGRWRSDLQRFDDDGQQRHGYWAEQRAEELKQLRLNWSVAGVGGRLQQMLMPTSVKVVPFGLITLILVAFVLAIGPVDYFMLGWIRRRRYTWLLFPLVTVAFTYFMVALSQRYLGTSDTRRSLVIVDVGEEGRPLRENRFELLFSARSRQIDHPGRHALLTALRDDVMQSNEPWERRGYYGGELRDTSRGVPRYTGRVPMQYTCQMRAAQWSPQVNRHFAIRTDARPPELDWSAIDGLMRLRWSAKRTEDLAALFANLPSQAGVIELWIDSDVTVRQTLVHRGVKQADLLQRMSVREQIRLFSIVSQISPTGGPNFEDLTILDATAPDQKVLMIVMPRGDDWIVYRRLYHGGA